MSNEILNIYDDQYATTYDERFHLSDFSKLNSEFELSVLKKIISKESNWLDVGCGTGYYLSAFPEVKRTGVDLSPSMLKIAKSRNPSASFFEEDFRNFLAISEKKWDAVSCMWMPYNYLDSMSEFDDFIESLTGVVEDDGSLFIPVFDLEDIRPHTSLDYEWKSEMPGYEGSILLTSTTWTWKEKVSGKTHKHLIAPQIDYFLERLQNAFSEIHVLRYPVYQPDWVSRKGILCKNRRANVSASIKWATNPSSFKSIGSQLSNKQVFSTKDLAQELIRRVINRKA